MSQKVDVCKMQIAPSYASISNSIFFFPCMFHARLGNTREFVFPRRWNVKLFLRSVSEKIAIMKLSLK